MKLNYPVTYQLTLPSESQYSSEQKRKGQRAGAYDFSFNGVSYWDKLPLRFLCSACLFWRFHRFNLASFPVEKSDKRRWTRKRPAERGQIESEVVADVSVPSTGESSARRSGGRISERIEVGGGRGESASVSVSSILSTLAENAMGEGKGETKEIERQEEGGGVQGSCMDGLTPHPHRRNPYPINPSPTQVHPTWPAPRVSSNNPQNTARKSAMTARC